jgi:hypothetical protein
MYLKYVEPKIVVWNNLSVGGFRADLVKLVKQSLVAINFGEFRGRMSDC